MRFTLNAFLPLWGAIIFLFFTPQAFAQTVSQYVKQSPAPDWVEVQEAPSGNTPLMPEGSQFYRLVDWQQRISATDNDRYRHYAIELKTADAVQDNSNFKISFDPSYQKVRLHTLDLIRNGKRLNRLKLSDFDIYRLETDRDKLLYDGRLQTALIIPDVQAGDVLDYSYTITGKNKALGPHYKTSTSLKYSVPIQLQHERILIHQNIPVNIKTHNNPIPPKESKVGPYRVYSWLQNDLEDMDFEDNLPAWYYSQPNYEFSSFESWADVGEYFAKKYDLNYTKGGPITDVANAIKKQSDKVKTRRRLALDYVHENIRYTGIEIGSGGYLPRPPEKTLAQKFGDCKDMTVLLLAILKELDIEAHPVLVDGDYRNGLSDMIPSHAAFDHVLVRTEAAGEVYLLDGTRGKQLGDLDRMEQGSYLKGLLLEKGKADLIDLEPKETTYYKDVQDTFEMLADSNNVSLESISTYYGYQADSMNSLLTNSGKEKIEKNFIEFFQDTYPDIEQIGEIEVIPFPEEGRFSVKVNYNLKKAWVADTESGIKSFEAYPSDVMSDVPDFKGGSRTMPYSLSHPRKSRHKLIFKLDETWSSLEDEDINIENEAFKFSKISRFKNGVYTENHIYQSKLDHIPAEIFSETMSEISKIEDELGVELTNGTGWLSNISEQAITMSFILWMVLAAIISFIGAIIRNNVDADWQEDQLYFPVKLSKFLLLSTVSISLYSYFWAYKNWRWIRDVGGDHNTPILRSWFMAFTNFALLPQLYDEKDETNGYSWYGPALGGILAILFFAAKVCGRIGDRIETAPMFLSAIGIFSFVILIPAVMQVNQLNHAREDVIAKNSEYHWTTIGFLIIFLPVFLLVLLGLFS